MIWQDIKTEPFKTIIACIVWRSYLDTMATMLTVFKTEIDYWQRFDNV